MRCYGVPERLCAKSVCNMWVHDDRCPNFDWLGPYKSIHYSKRPNLPDRPIGEIRIKSKKENRKWSILAQRFIMTLERK